MAEENIVLGEKLSPPDNLLYNYKIQFCTTQKQSPSPRSVVISDLAVMRSRPPVRLSHVPIRHLAVHNPVVRSLHAALHCALQECNRFLQHGGAVLGFGRVNALKTIRCTWQRDAVRCLRVYQTLTYHSL